MKTEGTTERGNNADVIMARVRRRISVTFAIFPVVPAWRLFLAALLALPLWSADGVAQTAAKPVRSAEWARPISAAGVPNLHQVAGNFYRSAQPDAQGFKTLATQYGVKAVISLRAFNSDEPLTRGLNLRLARFPIHTWHIEREDVVGALRALRQVVSKEPVLLHCQHGADRTGLITALYRIVYENWSKQAALEEMLNGKFGYHAVWGNIPKYIRNVDVNRLRRDIGIP
jgi:protein tyrosine/serine phosphatase